MTTAFAFAALAPMSLLTGVLGIVLVFAVLVVLSVAQRLTRSKEDADKPAIEAPAAPQAPTPAVAASVPDVRLVNVDEKEAAMIMAIVCDELQTPPEELYFRSIRRVDAVAQ